MVSRTALICSHYKAGYIKTAGKFCSPKTTENRKAHPIQPEKGGTGCVLGAGESSSGWRRMKPGEKTQDRLEKRGNSSIAWRKWRDGLELASQALLRCPALSAAAGPPCQSPTAAPSPPRCIRHRRRFGGDARHAPRAEASPPVTTKKERQADACLSFLAGAEGLEPSARGFGVDGGEVQQGAGKSRCCPVPAASKKRCGAGLVLRGNYPSQNRRKRAENPRKSRKHIDLNRHGPYNKKCRGNPAGVCCRQAVSHSLLLYAERG